MADKIEFIPASELPITEADEVDVLCVENGELKRKAGANFGGSEQAHLVVKFVAPLWGENGSISAENTEVSIESGSIENVFNVLSEGEVPVVKVKRFCLLEENFPVIEAGIHDCSVIRYGTMLYLTFWAETFLVYVTLDNEDADYAQISVKIITYNNESDFVLE